MAPSRAQLCVFDSLFFTFPQTLVQIETLIRPGGVVNKDY